MENSREVNLVDSVEHLTRNIYYKVSIMCKMCSTYQYNNTIIFYEPRVVLLNNLTLYYIKVKKIELIKFIHFNFQVFIIFYSLPI